MNQYASRGWCAVFDPSWIEEVVAKGESTSKEIDGLFKVFHTLNIVQAATDLQRLTTMPKPDVMRTLEIPVDVPSRRVSPLAFPRLGDTDDSDLDNSDDGPYNAG